MDDYELEQRPAFMDNPMIQRYLILFGRCLALAIFMGIFVVLYWNMSSDKRKPDPRLPQAKGPVEFETFEEMLELAGAKQLKEESEKLAVQETEFEAEKIELLKKRMKISDRILAIKHSRGHQRFALRSRAESRYRIEHIRLISGLSTEETRNELEELAGSFDSYDDEGIKKFAELSYVLLDLNATLENEDRQEQFQMLQRTRGSFLDAARGSLDDIKISTILYELSSLFCTSCKNKDRTKLLELFSNKYRETENDDVLAMVLQARKDISAIQSKIGSAKN